MGLHLHAPDDEDPLDISFIGLAAGEIIRAAVLYGVMRSVTN